MRAIYAYHLQAIFAGLVWIWLYLDRIKLKAIPDILRKYADPFLITSVRSAGLVPVFLRGPTPVPAPGAKGGVKSLLADIASIF